MPTSWGSLTIDEAQEALDEAADRIPPELFNYLNGGVTLVPNVVPSPHGTGLFTLGTYHNEPAGLGRYIVINYGSFVQVFGHRPIEAQKQELEKVLRHELTHHIESLAGVRDLEFKDEQYLEKYGENKPKKDDKK